MKTPSQIAIESGREYITPEDVQAAIDAGCEKDRLQQDVLEVIGGTRGFGVEDTGLTAYVAAEFKKGVAVKP